MFAQNLIQQLRVKPGYPIHKVKLSYANFVKAVKCVVPYWTGHSGRRTGAQWLSKAGTPLQEIQALTLHSGMSAKSLQSTRQYVSLSRRSPEARLQIRLSRLLEDKVALH